MAGYRRQPDLFKRILSNSYCCDAEGSVSPVGLARGAVSPGCCSKGAYARSPDAASNNVLGLRGAGIGVGRGVSGSDMVSGSDVAPGSQGRSSERGCSDQCKRQKLYFGHLGFSIREGSRKSLASGRLGMSNSLPCHPKA